MTSRINTKASPAVRAASVDRALAAQAAPLAHSNFMEGVSYDLSDPFCVLRMAAASCFFGEPQYYGAQARLEFAASGEQAHVREVLGRGMPATWAGMGPALRLERAIDNALAADAEKTLLIAVALRNEDHIRTTPQVIMVRAAYHPAVSGSGLVRRYAPQILQRADEPATQLAYARSAFPDKPIPNALRKAWAQFLSEQSEYALAKYRQENRGVKLVDVVNLVRPKATEALGKLIRGELVQDGSTWESLISKEGSTKESWTKARALLTPPARHMALLRNLVNLNQHGLLDTDTLAALEAGAASGKQLPFRYYSAYTRLKEEGAGAPVLDAVERCLTGSLGNLPKFKGRVMSLCDNSGSAQNATASEMGSMQVNHIANLTGVLTGMAADEGYVGVFGDSLVITPVRKTQSALDQAEALNAQADDIGTSTENGIWLFFRDALAKKEHWDHVFVYSDMQAGHGGLYGMHPHEYANFQWPLYRHNIDVAALIRQYHKTVNPNCKFYLVQVAGYTDTLAPDFYPNVVVLGGWGPGLLKFAHAMGGNA